MGGDIQPWPWRTHPGVGDMQLWARDTQAWKGHAAPQMGGPRKGGHIPWDRHSTQHRQGDPAPEGMYSPGYIPGRDKQPGPGKSHPRRESPAPDVTRVPPSSPSRDMPTSRHFLKRHCWQRLRLMRTIEQFSFLRHFLYWMFCWMLRRKKPCGARGRNHWGSPQCDGGSVPHPRPHPSTLQPSQAWTP